MREDNLARFAAFTFAVTALTMVVRFFYFSDSLIDVRFLAAITGVLGVFLLRIVLYLLPAPRPSARKTGMKAFLADNRNFLFDFLLADLSLAIFVYYCLWSHEKMQFHEGEQVLSALFLGEILVLVDILVLYIESLGYRSTPPEENPYGGSRRFLVLKLPALLLTLVLAWPSLRHGTYMIEGEVISVHGDPIEDVMVTVRDTPYHTSTGSDGTFTVRATPRKNILVFQKDGFDQEEARIRNRGQKITIGLYAPVTDEEEE